MPDSIALNPDQRPKSDGEPLRIPDHELLRRIGQGSYGEVWLARNIVGTLRAVKVVRRATFERADNFEREFRGMQKFEPISRSHEGLVDVLQIGRNDEAGYFYYVMELADAADSLSHRMGEGRGEGPSFQLSTQDPLNFSPKTLRSEQRRLHRLPVSDCVSIGTTLAAALAHLHERGLVHRDVKPSNVIFVNGTPKLADIGLVAAIDDAHSLVGTAGYIPPEGPGTPQADLYSLGKVLYEISLDKDRQEFPQLPLDLRSHPDHDALLDLNEVTLKACETDYRKRYQTAQEMCDDLVLLQRGQSVRRRRTVNQRLALARRLSLVTAAIGIVLVGAWLLVSRFDAATMQRSNAPAPVEVNSIAVLPVVNESGYLPHEYLCDALTDETINALTNCPALRVVSRPAIFAFKRATNDLRQIGEQLGVRTLLAGSMKKSSNQLHLAVRLLNVTDGAELWASDYDRHDTDIGTVQSGVVRSIASALHVQLPAATLHRLETNLVRKMTAYQLLEQSRSIRDDTQAGLNRIIQLLNLAIVKDPEFGQPYARLAHFYAESAGWMLPPDVAMTTAKQYALRAIQLDDSLAEAHMALGNVLSHHELDFPKAEAEYRHAIEVDPLYDGSYGFYAILLSRLARFNDAEQVLKQGENFLPNAQVVHAAWCWRYYLDRRFDDMLRAATNYLTVYPHHTLGLLFLGWGHERLGQYDDALFAAQKVVQLAPALDSNAFLGRVHARMGHHAEAQQALEKVRVMSQSPRGSGRYSAEILLALGDKDHAIEQLQQAVDEYPPTAFRLKTDPFWDDLRDDARFQAFFGKAGLQK